MELTLNIKDLSNLIIRSSDGVVYRLIKDDLVSQEQSSSITKTLVTQSELMDLYKCGQDRVKKWVAWGLHQIPDGKYVLYDVEELEELLKQRKI